MNFKDVAKQYFPGMMAEKEFVLQTYHALNHYGFSKSNTIASVGVCRDEMTRSLVSLVEESWGKSFNMSSLAGMLLLGKTGFLAAEQHSPRADGRERYVYIAMPHIAIGEDGTIGLCYRSGRAGASSACGALVAFKKELEDGPLSLELDPYDIEQSLLKQSLLRKVPSAEVPNLVTLTKLTHEIIVEDLQKMIELTVDAAQSDIAILTGIQIHAPHDVSYVWPGMLYVVVNQQQHEIKL